MANLIHPRFAVKLRDLTLADLKAIQGDLRCHLIGMAMYFDQPDAVLWDGVRANLRNTLARYGLVNEMLAMLRTGELPEL